MFKDYDCRFWKVFLGEIFFFDKGEIREEGFFFFFLGYGEINFKIED